MSAELYHNRVLELAANIPNVGTLEDADASVEKVSRVCGSVVRVDIRLSEDGETVYFAISDGAVTFHEFASLFRDRLDAPNALFLDGQVSRLYAPMIGRNEPGLDMGPIVGVVE